MRGLSAPLSAVEITALMQIRLQARLDPKHRRVLHRMLHLGLIAETPQGFAVTAVGASRCAREARNRGLDHPAPQDLAGEGARAGR